MPATIYLHGRPARSLDDSTHRGAARSDVPRGGPNRENLAWCRVLEFAEEFGVSVSL
ncbi:MAG: hypothetical protein NTW83_00985 [Cyanobacteria bacterium]|nr:hypothetical protein [Cyanobacteriota bacterium]